MRSLAIFLFFAAVPLSGLAAEPSLSQKLDAQWEAYRAARAVLLEQVQHTEIPAAERGLTRDRWEKLLRVPAGLDLSAEDIAALRSSQDARVARSRDLAKLDSPLDLDQVRTRGAVASFCRAFPKGGMLHVHPGGTLDREGAAELLAAANPALLVAGVLQDIDSSGGNALLYPEERQWLSQLPAGAPYLSLSLEDQDHFRSFLFLPPGKQPFPRFNSVFRFLSFANSDFTAYQKLLLRFGQKAAAEGVSYVEFTAGGKPAFYAFLPELENQTGLVIRTNRAFNRTQSLADLDVALGKLLAQAPNPYIVGIDFLDNEDGYPALEAGQVLYGTLLEAVLAGKSSLHRTMHAGEIGDIRNPRDAMILGAERLGHGVNLANDPVALEYAVLLHEPIEINISSNLRLTDVNNVGEHPFLRYLRLGLPVSLSTDDEGIFDIDINHECEQAVGQTDIRYSELKRMAFNSIETAFVADPEKKTLRDKLSERFVDFEKNLDRWRY